MPFDKFLDIETITEARRKAIQQSLRTISVDELKKIARDQLADFEGDPSQENFLRIIAEYPQGSFYCAVVPEGATVLYCSDEDTGVWILPGGGMGPLEDSGKRLLREAIGLPLSGEKDIRPSSHSHHAGEEPKLQK
jgi:hypothetical protein